MSTAPVPAILTLWSLGHSATDIAKRLGTKARTVSLIVEQARDIGDPRAVLHLGKNGRPIGRPNQGIDPADVEMVPAVLASKCCRGHLRTADNIDCSGNCRKCQRRKCRRGHRLTKQNTILNASGPQCRKCKNIVHRRSYERIKVRRAAMECRAVL